MTTTPSQTAITTQAHAGIQRSAPVIARGVAGASVIALLAVSSVMAPAIAGGVSLATVMAWLGGLGGNALAGWLTDWARENLAHYDGDDPDRERKLIEQIARDLTAQMGANSALAADIELVVQRTDAIPVALDALHGQGDKQARLLQLLLQDVQMACVENNQLHDATYRAVRERAQAILDTQATGDAALATELRAVLEAVQKLESAAQRPAPQPGGISVGGSVGRIQSVTVTGGAVGSIIGDQRNYYGAPPAAGAPAQHDVEDARELLSLQRQNLALHARRAARGDAAAAQQVAQARDDIARIKAQLRGWGQQVADDPGDEG